MANYNSCSKTSIVEGSLRACMLALHSFFSGIASALFSALSIILQITYLTTILILIARAYGPLIHTHRHTGKHPQRHYHRSSVGHPLTKGTHRVMHKANRMACATLVINLLEETAHCKGESMIPRLLWVLFKCLYVKKRIYLLLYLFTQHS